MQFSCSAKMLNAYLQLLMKVIDPKSTLPVLGNIMLDVKEDGITVIATNLENTLRLRVSDGVRVAKPGTTTVPAKLLSQYVSLLSDVEINFWLDEHNTLHLDAGRDKTEIQCIDPSEFPSLPDMDVQTQARTVSHQLANAFDKTAFACSNDIARAALTGVSLMVEQSMAYVAASDSYRLAEQRFELEQTSGADISCIIPKKAAEHLISIMGFDQQPVEMEAKQNQIVFQIGERMTFMTRLIEGSFPAYSQILAKEFATNALVNREDLMTAIRKTSLFSDEMRKSIEVTIGDGLIKLDSSQSQVGHTELEMECDTNGEKNNSNINAQYMIDILSKLKNENVSVGINAPHLPLGVSIPEEEYFQYIIMPLRK